LPQIWRRPAEIARATTHHTPVEFADRAKQATRYNPTVDGLRAIAVLSVVTYHVDGSLLPGGFAGVDVFFVISGYLIINQIVAGIGDGSFRFGEFFGRRALRILPPYLLVVVATLLLGWYFIVLPWEFKELTHEAFYSALMVANQHFLSTQGYFDTAADAKPLLHLWSLSVEEQFYLVAPFLLVCGIAVSRLTVGKFEDAGLADRQRFVCRVTNRVRRIHQHWQ
jgi:peptidoglycan/LPS O-acetylase OafA/YrhL